MFDDFQFLDSKNHTVTNDEVELISLSNLSYSQTAPKYTLRIDTITEFQGKCFNIFFHLWLFFFGVSILMIMSSRLDSNVAVSLTSLYIQNR